MNCPNCQRKIPGDSHFCCYCGQSLRRCASCELFFDTKALFCGSCGGSLISIDSSPDDSSRPQDPDPPQDSLDEDSIGYLIDIDDASDRYRLSLGDNTVGAGGNNDIVINRPAVSWNHAILICRNGRVLVQDSASTNGTFVNDQLVRTPRPVSHDEIVRFASEKFRIWLRPSFR